MEPEEMNKAGEGMRMAELKNGKRMEGWKRNDRVGEGETMTTEKKKTTLRGMVENNGKIGNGTEWKRTKNKIGGEMEVIGRVNKGGGVMEVNKKKMDLKGKMNANGGGMAKTERQTKN